MSDRASCERDIATSEREYARAKRAIADVTHDVTTKRDLVRQALLHAESARLHDALADTYERQDVTTSS